ncbi:chromatic acclimation sensor CcaS [Geminocystis sp. NIES-3708]|uniref:sensor histidine kinase n=1 Tax=Geminocystis sp. NIES-3708 TaxID=1615909 RepID=UPI0005FCD7F0|nr:ATP-binding protein [Geminocystis sp. NIES-3708]BAQ61084.1 chromatic acclimation sensor CcaS [Geminocystis sp. NIES-3708]
MNLFNFFNPLITVISFYCFIVLIGFYLLKREINLRREAEFILKQKAKRERLIHQITHQIRLSLNIEEVLNTTVTEVRSFLQTDRVIIFRLWDNGTGSAITENVRSPYPQILGKTFPEEVFPQEYHQAYIEGKTRAINDIEQTDVEDCLAEFVKQFGVKAKLVVPIIQDIRNRNLENQDESRVNSTPILSIDSTPCSYLWGLLIAHQCSQPRIWEDEEIELMKQLATQVAIAIQQSELHTQLQQLNTELEERVQQRTEELALTNESLKAEIIEREKTEAALRHTNHTLESLIKALRHSEERFRQVVENALDIITIIDQNGTIHYQSPSVEKVLGYTFAEFIQENFFSYIHPDEIANIRSSIADALEDNPIVRPIEFRCRNKQREWHHLEAITQKFIDYVPETRIVITSRDISERKRLKEVHKALEREKELNIVKTRFFSMASHEFRTPLSTVLAAAQVLENATTHSHNPQKQLRNLHRIQNAVKNMVQLLDDILTINRAETGNLEFNPQPLALENFCRQFMEEIKLSTNTQHHLKFICQGKRIDVCLDEKLLRSILANLLSNAIKYSPQNSSIYLYLIFHSDKIQIKVRDKGVGISPEDMREIFEPFYRGQNVRHLTGTGLGLVVVKKCVDLHSGSITIRSQMNKGTTVKIILPYN